MDEEIQQRQWNCHTEEPGHDVRVDEDRTDPENDELQETETGGTNFLINHTHVIGESMNELANVNVLHREYQESLHQSLVN